MGSSLATPAAPDPEDAPASPWWISDLRQCHRVELSAWETHPYRGGSLHPMWSAALTLHYQQHYLEGLFALGHQPTHLALCGLDPIAIFSGLQRDQRIHRSLIRDHTLNMWRTVRRFDAPTGMQQVRHAFTKSKPWVLRYKYSVADVLVCGGHNIVLVLEPKRETSGSVVFGIWALHRIRFRGRLLIESTHQRKRILSMLRECPKPPDGLRRGRWVYVFLSGYKFKGRSPGFPITQWEKK